MDVYFQVLPILFKYQLRFSTDWIEQYSQESPVLRTTVMIRSWHIRFELPLIMEFIVFFQACSLASPSSSIRLVLHGPPLFGNGKIRYPFCFARLGRILSAFQAATSLLCLAVLSFLPVCPFRLLLSFFLFRTAGVKALFVCFCVMLFEIRWFARHVIWCATGRCLAAL